MMQARMFPYPSSDGIHTIHAREWLPEGPPRAIVQIVHGLSDHIGWYCHVGCFLAEHGFLVCGEDHLGHGHTASDGLFGYFAPEDGWNLVTQDVFRLRQLQAERYPDVPYFMLGHSMGSFLARTCLYRYPGQLDGVILSGTGQEPAVTVAAGKALAGLLTRLRGPRHISLLLYAMSMGAYNKAFRPNRTPCDWISRDERMVDACLADPLRRFIPTVSMYRDMLGGLQAIADPQNLSKMEISTPVYFFSGDHDPVGAMGKGVEKVVRMFRDAGCTDITVKLYPGGRHEMFNEINKQEVMDDLLAWLESKL